MRAGASGALDAAQAAAADAGQKAMMPIAGRPFLDYVLHRLAEAGIKEVGLVLSRDARATRAYYTALRPSRLSFTFLTQPEPDGTAGAVLAGEAWVGADPFLVLNSDNLYPMAAMSALCAAAGPAAPGFQRDALYLPLERVGAFALLEAAGPEGPRHRCLSRIVEKPGREAVEAAGPDALISMNIWRFDARIFDACRDVPRSARGERELPQAVGLMASRGVCVEVIPVRGEVLDLSSRNDVAVVDARLRGQEIRL